MSELVLRRYANYVIEMPCGATDDLHLFVSDGVWSRDLKEAIGCGELFKSRAAAEKELRYWMRDPIEAMRSRNIDDEVETAAYALFDFRPEDDDSDLDEEFPCEGMLAAIMLDIARRSVIRQVRMKDVVDRDEIERMSEPRAVGYKPTLKVRR